MKVSLDKIVSVNLNLTTDEAAVLIAVANQIGGDPLVSYRKLFDDLREKIYSLYPDLEHTVDYIEDEYVKEGQIYFNDGFLTDNES